MERQNVEETVTNEFLYPPGGGKAKELPAAARLRALVDQRIAAKRETERMRRRGE